MYLSTYFSWEKESSITCILPKNSQWDSISPDMNTTYLLVGIDVGSTTVKAAVVNPADTRLLYSRYQRHNAAPSLVVRNVLEDLAERFGSVPWRVSYCGSGGQSFVSRTGGFFIQEVVANTLAVKTFFPRTRVAIELGGQDAKVIFFRQDEKTGQLIASDMRMNGSCAGGTGAFIDQIAELLHVRPEDFGSLAKDGSRVYEISGRCGVFAKTDIQPLLNQGVSREDIALSTFHAIAKQTIGGLAQGMEIHPPVIFEGGPLTFNPVLVQVFAQRLGLTEDQIILPPKPEILVAYGAALGGDGMFPQQPCDFSLDRGLAMLQHPSPGRGLDRSFPSGVSGADSGKAGGLGSALPEGLDVNGSDFSSRPLFLHDGERTEFYQRHSRVWGIESCEVKASSSAGPDDQSIGSVPPKAGSDDQSTGLVPGSAGSDDQRGTPTPSHAGADRARGYVGVDGGSTTTKMVLISEDGVILDRYYSGNAGEPLEALKTGLLQIKKNNPGVEVLGVGTTGYAEHLFAAALRADYHNVETVAHAEAAKRFNPDVGFILDIGGQDMKAIQLDGGIVTGIVLNEACSAGCGSFIETYARSLGIPLEEIAERAFESTEPSCLGSRCTVFMNSSIITEQKNGKTTGDILAGLCKSIIENVFTKVVRVSNIDSLGETIMVQGGTFKNDAVLRAMELYTGKRVVRPPIPGEMGALGVALLTKQDIERRPRTSSFIGLEGIEGFTYRTTPGLICPFCSNNCNRTAVEFPGQGMYVTGNRCERGQVLGEAHDPGVRQRLKDINTKLSAVPDLVELQNKLLVQDYGGEFRGKSDGIRIGLPRALEFYQSLPFWKAFFTALGCTVVVSDRSSYPLFEEGLPLVPSDTVCFPGKLAHGHVENLIAKGVDRIFMPMMIRVPSEIATARDSKHMCAVVAGYPLVIRNSDDPLGRHGIPLDNPVFHWYDKQRKDEQILSWARAVFGVSDRIVYTAIEVGERAMAMYKRTLEEAGEQVLGGLKEGEFGVVLAGRPYHYDELVCHSLSKHFTKLGIPVLTLDSLPSLGREDLGASRMDVWNPFHGKMLAAAMGVAKNARLELVQIVSFGCGHDAVISDEMVRILHAKSEKEMLILKLDEGENLGPLHVRITSFIETIKAKRRLQRSRYHWNPLDNPYKTMFTKRDRKGRTILIPNLSPSFSMLIGRVIESKGYRVKVMPLADKRAIELGKRYVHNDICFPAQINIGEALRSLESGILKGSRAAVGIANNCKDCRAGHYVPLTRKALDDAGYSEVPIITTGRDDKGIHPGFRLGLGFRLQMMHGLPAIDALERLVRMVRPYERSPGEAQRAYDASLRDILESVHRGVGGVRKSVRRMVQRFNRIEVDRTTRNPRVGVIGEILMNFHPVANGHVESYLEQNGLEVVEATLSDFFRRDFVIDSIKAARRLLPFPKLSTVVGRVTSKLFAWMVHQVERELQAFHLYEGHFDLTDMMESMKGIIDPLYTTGEGWLIPGEIAELAKRGVNSFVIINPFGCIPNHITGRGMIKKLKELYPHIQILSLDYDPDTSFANIENRLQMLIMNARGLEEGARTRREELSRAGI